MANISGPMDRAEMIDAFSEALRETSRHRAVKTRLIEAHAPEQSPDGVAALLEDLRERGALKATQQEESIWAFRGEHGEAYVIDALDPRFWLLHTTAPAGHLEQLVRTRLLSDARLDTAWIPSDLLLALPGERRLVRSSYESHRLFAGQRAPGGDTQRVKIKMEGTDPDDLLDLLRSSERFAGTAALGAVGAQLRDRELGEARVVADFQGRCVTSGSSFEVALHAIWALLDSYTALIARLESAYRLRTPTAEGGGFTLEGGVATLELPDPIPDLDGFLAALFSCREPFRLWAAYSPPDGDYWVANAVDLHVGQPLRLEGTRDRIHVLLSETTCGNTLARLIVNLQHHLSAKVTLPEVETVNA